jgi:ADP-ribose pyrophosphatase
MSTHEPLPTVLEERTAFEGRVFTVHADLVRLPNGRDVQMDVIRHAPSVVLVPMPDPEHVILIRQYRYPVNAWLWEVPAGSIDPGEDVEAAVRRECHEEIGQWPDAVTRLGTFLPTPGICDEVMSLYKVTGLRVPEHKAEADADEMIVPHTVTLAQAKAMVALGEIPDMKTAVALMMI